MFASRGPSTGLRRQSVSLCMQHGSSILATVEAPPRTILILRISLHSSPTVGPNTRMRIVLCELLSDLFAGEERTEYTMMLYFHHRLGTAYTILQYHVIILPTPTTVVKYVKYLGTGYRTEQNHGTSISHTHPFLLTRLVYVPEQI